MYQDLILQYFSLPLAVSLGLLALALAGLALVGLMATIVVILRRDRAL